MNRSALLCALSPIKKIPCSKTWPTYDMALIANGALQYFTGDLVVEISLDTADTEPVVVPVRRTLAALNAMDGLEVWVRTDNDGQITLTDSDGACVTTQGAMSPDDMPCVPTLDLSVEPTVVGCASMHQAVRHVVHAMSTDPCNPNIYGLYIDATDNSLSLVTTDGHRLAKETMTSTGPTLNALVCVDTAGALDALLATDDLCAITCTDQWARIETEHNTLWARIEYDSQFPDYHRVIPTDEQPSAVLAVKAAQKAIKKCQKVSGSSDVPVSLSFDPDHGIAIEFSTEECSGQFPIQGQARQTVHVLLNAKYLQDALKQCSHKDVPVRTGDPRSPVVLDDGAFTAVIMPRRPE